MLRSDVDSTSSFEPEQLEAMSKAFSSACTALHVFAGDTHGREAIASRVIHLAGRGIYDPAVLSERVVAEARAIT